MIDDALTTVARYEWRMDALLARCRLESAGIQTYLADECTLSIYWDYAKFLGGMRLQVGAEDAEDARAVLEEPPQPAEEPILTENEAKTDRLLRAAVFGAISSPVLIFALWLLLDAVFLGGPWTKKERRQIIVASALIVPLALLPVAGAFLRMRPLFPY